MATETSSMKYRSKHEIISEILTATMEPRAKTRIMYACNLSFAQLKSYLAWLLTENLLSYDNGTQRYLTTYDGRAWLKNFSKVPHLNREKGACP